MKRLLIAVVALGFSLAPLSAFAQQDTGAKSEKVTEFNFKDDDIEAGIVGPDEEILRADPDHEPKSFDLTRANFLSELLKSAENL